MGFTGGLDWLCSIYQDRLCFQDFKNSFLALLSPRGAELLARAGLELSDEAPGLNADRSLGSHSSNRLNLGPKNDAPFQAVSDTMFSVQTLFLQAPHALRPYILKWSNSGSYQLSNDG